MEYFIYENWTHNKAVIHLAECVFCNQGKGFRENTTNKNGQWLGPFKDEKTAKSVAVKTKRKSILKCSTCS